MALGIPSKNLPSPPLTVLREQAAELFVKAVHQAMGEGVSILGPSALREMHALIPDPELYGYSCMSDAEAALVPRSDTLTWFAWCTQVITVRGFALKVRVRPLCLIGYGAAIEVSSVDRKPLPFTETGFKSLMVPFSELKEWPGPAEFVADLFTDDPIQTGLF